MKTPISSPPDTERLVILLEEEIVVNRLVCKRIATTVRYVASGTGGEWRDEVTKQTLLPMTECSFWIEWPT